MKAAKSTTGSNRMRDAGKVQVSLYFTPKQIASLDKIAECEHRKRAGVALGFVLDALEKKGSK
jgi:hypothetical protein